MKKGVFVILLFLILINLTYVYSANDRGVKICNVNRDCGVADGICPNDYFSPGVTCYITDPDCCIITKAVWSKDISGTPISSVEDGKSVYLYVETLNCNGKTAKFETYGVKEGWIYDSEVPLDLNFASKVVNANKVYALMTAIQNSNPDITKLKFKVNINPTAESENQLEITEGEGQVLADSELCTEFWTSPELCSTTLSSCPQCTEFISSGSACNGWKCTTGECINGQKSVNCPEPPAGCQVSKPGSSQIKCYEKTVPFPFFSGFNVLMVVLLLSGYYGIIIYKKK